MEGWWTQAFCPNETLPVGNTKKHTQSIKGKKMFGRKQHNIFKVKPQISNLETTSPCGQVLIL